MERYADRLEAAHQSWRLSGKDPVRKLTGLQAALASIWVYHHTKQGKQPRASFELEQFVHICMLDVDQDAIWRERRYCDNCHQTYKMENMSTCVECGKTVCWRCGAFTCEAGGGEITDLSDPCDAVQ